MSHWRHNEFHDILGSDAYRSWLISRNDPPIVYPSSDIAWRRLRALLRRATSRIASFFAAIHIAVVAHKVRRARGAFVRLDGRAPSGRRS
ncbi:hypothetical protein [Rhodopseudomonas telluris]|uniref:Uncharacterized protein n=1 Tax=Rhodopseudomonas telluris TaxID=644215 RepID=A0ABV6ETS8_9BRAD